MLLPVLSKSVLDLPSLYWFILSLPLLIIATKAFVGVWSSLAYPLSPNQAIVSHFSALCGLVVKRDPVGVAGEREAIITITAPYLQKKRKHLQEKAMDSLWRLTKSHQQSAQMAVLFIYKDAGQI